MPGYYFGTHKRRRIRLPHGVWSLLIIVLVVVVGVLLLLSHVYVLGLQPLASANQQAQTFTVEKGQSVRSIADNLQGHHLIRSSLAFQLYVRLKALHGGLQAGTYAISPDQDVQSIVSTMARGKVATRLVTILPGRRIDQVRADLINAGFSPSAVDAALQPGQYTNLPVLAIKPANVTTLEGLLWPDSFQKTAATSPSTIVRESLSEMGQQLTPSLEAAFTAENLTAYQGIVLASIVQQEVNKPGDMAQAAQVFLSRLKSNSSLGSDVTAYYGAIEAGQPPSLQYDSPYNTLIHTGLPPTPISTVSTSSLNAVAHPAPTHWLYFVAGDNGTTYFSTSLQEHQAQVQQYCHKLCSQ